MNLLARHLRTFPKNFTGFERNYSKQFKTNFSIDWVKPKKVSCILPEKSGDLGLDYKILPEELCKDYKNNPELDDADENVKKLFSVEFNRGKDKAKLMKDRAVTLVQRHIYDIGSHECRIAKMTSEIHKLQDYMKNNPRNKVCKKVLKEKIDMRKKCLKRLREWDYKKFEWVLEKLNLIYKPEPEKYYTVVRKESIRKLADIYIEKVKKEKLDAYKAELKSQQKDFFKFKADQLAFIREEEIACGLTPTISLEEIEDAKRKAENMKS